MKRFFGPTSFTALLAGVVFGIGLTLSGMTQPAKVIGFLDLFGNWDPSLAFVMGGAVIVHALTRPLVLRRTQPIAAASFRLPNLTAIDGRLVAGASLFGLGWGLVGICPGPGIVGLGSGDSYFLVFFPAMLVGMLIHGRLAARPSPSAEPRA